MVKNLMKMSNLEKENDKNALALFKYSIIAPLINDTHDCSSKAAFYRKVANKQYTLPNGKKTVLNASTIKKWYLNYCKYGFECLKSKSRNDEGVSRKLPPQCIDKIFEIKEHFPHITGKAIYQKLIENGDILASNVSLASLYRFMKSNNLYFPHNTPERKAFEMEFSNDCWQR